MRQLSRGREAGKAGSLTMRKRGTASCSLVGLSKRGKQKHIWSLRQKDMLGSIGRA